MCRAQGFSAVRENDNSIDYICTKCRYILENGDIMAREICPKCKATNPFVIFEWDH